MHGLRGPLPPRGSVGCVHRSVTARSPRPGATDRLFDKNWLGRAGSRHRSSTPLTAEVPARAKYQMLRLRWHLTPAPFMHALAGFSTHGRNRVNWSNLDTWGARVCLICGSASPRLCCARRHASSPCCKFLPTVLGSSVALHVRSAHTGDMLSTSTWYVARPRVLAYGQRHVLPPGRRQ